MLSGRKEEGSEMAVHLQYIFVHGLSGWGSYDAAYRRMPYWGMRNGDLIAFLREKGFDCYAASVSPSGSAWDRACELYAQLAGARVDYGEAHSGKYGHERYGRDFSDCPLIGTWNADTRLVLLGHSFGGATVRMFSELMARGDPEERKACAENLPPLFAGGHGEMIRGIVALASPMNGTTAYDLFRDPGFDPSAVPVPAWSRWFAKIMSVRVKPETDSRDKRDYAAFDMCLDHAAELNRRISTLKHVYYFSVPCSITDAQPDGTHRPARSIEPLFMMRSCQIGAYSGRTAAGMEVGPSWRENDGLVNTSSAMAPSDAPSVPLNRDGVRPGVWNVFPVLRGDHMWLQGGLFRRHDIRPFYLDLLAMIDKACREGAAADK